MKTRSLSSQERYRHGFAAGEQYGKDQGSDLEMAKAIARFADDPPDDAFQVGYLDGLRSAFIEAATKVIAR